MERDANDERIIHEFPKNEKEVVRATTKFYKGKKYVSIRLYFRAQGRDGWHPTRKGLTLSTEQLPNLVKAVLALEEATKSDGAHTPF